MNIKALKKDQQDQLKEALYNYDEIDLFNKNLSAEYPDGIIPLAYTTYGGDNDDDCEIQINFNLNSMRFEEYINNELFINPNVVYDRNFDELIRELNNSSLDDMIRTCADEIFRRQDLEWKYERLNKIVGDDEYSRALWYLQKENVSIDEIFDPQDNYDKATIDKYYESNKEPDQYMWSNYLISINNDVGGIQAFIDSLNKSKDGKNKEKDNFKSKAQTK